MLKKLLMPILVVFINLSMQQTDISLCFVCLSNLLLWDCVFEEKPAAACKIDQVSAQTVNKQSEIKLMVLKNLYFTIQHVVRWKLHC